MTARAFIVENGIARASDRDAAAVAIGTASLVWVHLDGAEKSAGDWLKARGLDDLVVGALLATETRPRLDMMDGGALLNLRGPDAAKVRNPDLLASVRLWVTSGWVVSVTMRDLAALECVDDQMRRGEVTDPGDLVSALAAAITDELDPDVIALGDTLDDCEEMFGPSNALQLRRTIAKARAKAIAYRRFVAPQQVALERLANVQAPWLADDDRLHLREVADRAARMAEELESIRERAALIHEQLTDLRAELIDTRSLVIAIVALVFLPLTFLTGLLGMNVAGIPYAHEPWAFAGVVAICIAVAVGVAVYFIRARWFR
jgi:zinc transporter